MLKTKGKQVTIYLSVDTWEAVKAAAIDDDRPITRFLERLLRGCPEISKHLPKDDEVTLPAPPAPSFPSRLS